MTFTQMRLKAGQTQMEAADYIWTSVWTVRRIESGLTEDKARCELYRLKLLEDGLL